MTRLDIRCIRLDRMRLLKIGVTGVGKTKMWAEKEGINSKGFPENITKRFEST